MGSSLLTYTTSPTDLTDGLERLLSPLKIFKLPVHEFALMMTIALRFIPTLIEETDKIMSVSYTHLETYSLSTKFTGFPAQWKKSSTRPWKAFHWTSSSARALPPVPSALT